DQLPLPGRPLGQVILQRRVKRLHLPTPAASLHLRPPGHPSHHHPASRAALGRRGGREPPRPLRPPQGGGKNLTSQVLVAGLTPPTTRHIPSLPRPRGKVARREATGRMGRTANPLAKRHRTRWGEPPTDCRSGTAPDCENR